MPKENTPPLLFALLSTVLGCFEAPPLPDLPEIPATPTPATPTPVGTPTDAPVTAVIGPEGGTLSSADGVVSVVVPPGAVGAATEFGIQPITNNAPAGIEGAYRLTPEGMTFTVPVALSFAYSEDELVATSPAALSVAFQDHEGLWEWQDGAVVDEDAARIELATDHFSDWSRVSGLQIHADRHDVEPSETVQLVLMNCLSTSSTGKAHMVDCHPPLTDEYLSPLVTVPGSWAVNGTPGGGGTFGTVVEIDGWTATYTAPSAEPPREGNPVAVSIATPRGLLVANIQVGGADYLVSISHTGSSLAVCNAGVFSTLSDEASFVLERLPEGGYSVQQIVNATATYTPPTAPGATVVVDSAPEWTIDNGTAEAIPDGIYVRVSITQQVGDCTLSAENGSVPFPGLVNTTELVFTIDLASFGPDGTAPVTDLTGQNTITAQQLSP